MSRNRLAGQLSDVQESQSATEMNQTGPDALKKFRAKTMPRSILMMSTDGLPSTDPTARPVRSVSFREKDDILVFAQHEAPMACGPDWDPTKAKNDEDSDDDDLNFLFTTKLPIVEPPRRVASEPPISFSSPKTGSPLVSRCDFELGKRPPALKAALNFDPKQQTGGNGSVIWLKTLSFDNFRWVLFGTLAVRIISMGRAVFVRYTTDGWKTQTDLNAKNADHIPRTDPMIDHYIFEIPLPETIAAGSLVELCLCYRTNGQEFWDSNGGANYHVRFETA